MSVPCGVIQRKPHRCQRLAASGGYGQGEQAGGKRGLCPDVGKNLSAQTVQSAFAGEAGYMCIESGGQIGQNVSESRPRPIMLAILDFVIKAFRIAEIGIHEA